MAPPITLTGIPRGVRCTSCGADEWVKRSDKKNCWRCVPCHRRLRREWTRTRTRAEPSWELWRKARERARRKRVPFLISVEDVLAVWPSDGRCPVLGIALRAGVGQSQDCSPTLDRLNPQWGYEPGNIAVISMRANRMKNDATSEELEQIVTWMRARGLA